MGWLVAGLGLLFAAAPAQAAFPGRDGRLAFAANQGTTFQIYTANADGSDVTQVTNDPLPNLGPAWSADGRKIAFWRDQSPNWSRNEVWTMNADGTSRSWIGLGVDPAWSPDGRKVVFARMGDDSSQLGGIYVVNADGTGLVKIAPGFRDSRDPEWSPGGGKIAFTADSLSGLGFIYTVNPDGTGLTRITTSGADHDPAWSPDGAKIAFYREFAPNPGIYTMNRDGSAQTIVTSTGDGDSYPAWSPSGAKIAFQRGDIWTMNVDGSGATSVANGFKVNWQPIPINGYARPKGATPFLASLVVAYEPCSTPNEQHGPPLDGGSCAPPAQVSDFATVGTPPQDPAASAGSVRADAVPDQASTPADEADVALRVSITDVRARPALTDYAGELRATTIRRITDKDNTPGPDGGTGAATVQDGPLAFTVPCAPTTDTTIGSLCSVTTTADTLVPGSVKGGLRSIWQLAQVEVYDGGTDGQASTTGDNTLFMNQGIFTP
jgi:dipeptidyl aminopeptidase/acylaminoacyl peptidase